MQVKISNYIFILLKEYLVLPYICIVFMHKQHTIILSEEDKLRHRLSLSYTERFKSAMQMIRLVQKLKEAKITKPTVNGHS